MLGVGEPHPRPALVRVPGGGRLLVPWPAADQWLFLRADGAAAGPSAVSAVATAAARRTAVANIARQFAPGAERAVFPHSVQWCCP